MTAPLVAPVEARFRATGVEQVQRGLRLVGTEGQATSSKVGASMRQIASGVESIARQGKVGGEALKGIISQGAEMATQYGPGGAVVSALAVVGLAIYEHITGRMKEAQEEIKRTRQEIGGLANSGSMSGLLAKAREINFGTPFDKDGNVNPGSIVKGAYRGSLAELRSRMKFYKDNLANPAVSQKEMRDAIKKLGPVLAAKENEMRVIETAIAIMNSQPADSTILPMHSRAKAPPTPEMIEQVRQFHIQQRNDFMMRFRNGPEIIGKYSNNGSTLSEMANQGLAALGHPQVAATLKTAQEDIADQFRQQVNEPLRNTIQKGMADTIGGAIADGITAGFSGGGITGAFKAAGEAILAGIGGIMKQMGEVWVSYGVSMTALGQALWNPFTSGPAAIAIGASLIALGTALGAVSHGGRAGGGAAGGSGYSTQSQIIDRGIINPAGTLISSGSSISPAIPVVFNVIGTNDPGAQRDIMKLIRNAQNRGVI